jgi:thiol-disulfide isomerase/thioredoxin
MRLLCAAALSLTLGLWLAFSGTGKPVSAADDKADRSVKLEELKKKYDATFKELLERFNKAEAGDKAGIRAEIREETLLMAEKVLKVAEADPKDEVGFNAAAFILEKAGQVGAGGPSVEKAVAIIADNHAANPKVKGFLLPAMSMGAAGEKLLKAVAEKSADKETKGTALFLRGYVLAQKVDDEEDDKKIAELVKQATALLEEATKLAPDAKIGRSQTVAKLAAGELESLKAVLALGVGKAAPAVASKTLDGKDVKLADYKGKVVLLDIWATWCGPCRAMIPHEREMAEKLKDKPFVLVSVSADDKKETLEKFLEKEKMPWVHWWNEGPDSEVLKKYRVKAFPTLYLIDHAGVVRHKWIGNPGHEKIEAAVEELVKAATKAKG